MRKEEILGLPGNQVDLMEGKISLKPTDTKDQQPRVIYPDGELLEVIHFQRALRDQKFPSCPWFFFGEKGGTHQGLSGFLGEGLQGSKASEKAFP
jgi:hypothetical protein